MANPDGRGTLLALRVDDGGRGRLVSRDVSVSGANPSGLSQDLAAFMNGGFEDAAKRIEELGKGNPTGNPAIPSTNTGKKKMGAEEKDEKKKKKEGGASSAKPTPPSAKPSPKPPANPTPLPPAPAGNPPNANDLTDEDRRERGHDNDEDLMEVEDAENPPTDANSDPNAPNTSAQPDGAVNPLGSAQPGVVTKDGLRDHDKREREKKEKEKRKSRDDDEAAGMRDRERDRERVANLFTRPLLVLVLLQVLVFRQSAHSRPLSWSCY